jgi:hypothetical protein
VEPQTQAKFQEKLRVKFQETLQVKFQAMLNQQMQFQMFAETRLQASYFQPMVQPPEEKQQGLCQGMF